MFAAAGLLANTNFRAKGLSVSLPVIHKLNLLFAGVITVAFPGAQTNGNIWAQISFQITDHLRGWRCSRRLCFTIGLFSSLLPAAWCVVNSTILTSIQHP